MGARPAALADLLFAAETDRVFADSGHSLDFINKAFECVDLIGWQHAADMLPTVIGRMVAEDSAYPASYANKGVSRDRSGHPQIPAGTLDNPDPKTASRDPATVRVPSERGV
jgi:hypothetical protein